jgi:hypothetical protein
LALVLREQPGVLVTDFFQKRVFPDAAVVVVAAAVVPGRGAPGVLQDSRDLVVEPAPGPFVVPWGAVQKCDDIVV